MSRRAWFDKVETHLATLWVPLEPNEVTINGLCIIWLELECQPYCITITNLKKLFDSIKRSYEIIFVRLDLPRPPYPSKTVSVLTVHWTCFWYDVSAFSEIRVTSRLNSQKKLINFFKFSIFSLNLPFSGKISSIITRPNSGISLLIENIPKKS